MKKILLIALASVLLLGCVAQQPAPQATPTPAAAAVTATPTASPSPEVPSEAVVRFYAYAVEPREVTIKAGGAVTWVNDEQAFHGVSFGEYGSDELGPGQAYIQQFDAPGDYNYTCGVHDYPAERGVVHVVP
ncbi:MAG: plastocyanin/azurin family copper-binding protein [Candidatus Micrarchaeota archaeon]